MRIGHTNGAPYSVALNGHFHIARPHPISRPADQKRTFTRVETGFGCATEPNLSRQTRSASASFRTLRGSDLTPQGRRVGLIFGCQGASRGISARRVVHSLVHAALRVCPKDSSPNRNRRCESTKNSQTDAARCCAGAVATRRDHHCPHPAAACAFASWNPSPDREGASDLVGRFEAVDVERERFVSRRQDRQIFRHCVDLCGGLPGLQSAVYGKQRKDAGAHG
jgi:hypothetical protein